MTDAIRLELRPHDKHPSGYWAVLDGEPLLWSRQPLLDAARALLARGVAPETVLETRHRGSDIVAQRSTVGEAAKWTIEESDRGGLRRRPWKAHPGRGGAPEIERGGEGRGILPPEPRPPFSGTPRTASDDFAPRAKRARR